MNDFVAELKKRIRIEDVIGETVELERNHGRGFTRGAKRGAGEHGLVVDLDGQRFAWNGNSEYGGGRYNDVITWVMMRDRVDFKRAVEVLARKAGMELPKWSEEQQQRFAAVRVQEDILEVAQRVFAEWLWNPAGEKALAYVRGRGWSDETIKKAGLGFTGWGTKEEYEQMKNAIATANDLHSAAAVAILGLRGGVAAWCERRQITPKQRWVENDAIPSMLGWKDVFGLVYPCIYFGRTNYLYRRHLKLNESGEKLIGSDEPKSYNLPRELVGERQLFFNHVYSPRAERVIFVEGPADAVTLGQWGLDAVAIAGTAWGDHEAELSRLRYAKHGDKPAHEALYVALDADKAGQDAMRGKDGEFPLVEMLGPMCRLVKWKEKDANDWLQRMVLEGVSAAEQVERALEQVGNAKPLAIEVARWAGAQTDDHAKTKAVKRAFEVIAKMGDENTIMRYAPDFLTAFKPLGETVKGIREFSRLLKTAMGKGEGEEDKENVVYTFGGRIGDWLLEYCYDREAKKVKFAYRDPSGKVDEADDLLIDGIRYKPNSPTDRMIERGAVLFPTGLARKNDGTVYRMSTSELTKTIAIKFLQNYLFPDSKWAYLAAYWLVGTWIYDNFDELVYLRMVGDAGAGKSALLALLWQTAYRAIKMSGADSEPTFFRTVDDFRGTIFFEEADLPDESGADNPIVKFINLGAMRGNFIYRMEEFVKPDGSKGWRPTPFETFCPKAFAMRGDFMDNAVASRAISIKLTAAETSQLKEKGISLRLSRKTIKELEFIRNLCLTWRLFEYSLQERELGWDLVDVEIPARFNQVTVPMKSLALNIDGTRDEKFLAQITLLLREHYQEIVGDNSTTWEARVAEAAWKLYCYTDLHPRLDIRADGSIFMKIGDVTALANNIADEMNEQGADLRIKKEEASEEGGGSPHKGKKSYELGAQKVGKIIRDTFQLHTPPRKGNGVYFEWDEAKMYAIGRKYGALPSDEQIAKGRQSLAAIRAKLVKPNQIVLGVSDD